MKKAVLICLCILVVGGGAWFMIPTILGLRYKNDTLQSCRVSTDGGMLGGRSEAKLLRDDDGNAVLRVSEKETHADREITTEYHVDGAAFDRLREMVNEYHLYAASKRPYSRITVLDAATTTVSFTYDSGDFSISQMRMMSGKMRKGFSVVKQYLYSLAVGDGVATTEPQRAVLHLKSGYTLQFVVEDAFDGKLDAILGEEHDVSAFGESGIVLAAAQPDCSGAKSAGTGADAATIVYDPQSEQVILLYAAYTFPEPVYLLAKLDGYAPSACPLIAEMEGAYSMQLN